jgi:protein-S-isoprenylcysteine O-methyltransferase Ste14
MIRRTGADLALFLVTAVELGLLLFLTPAFAATDWIYLSQHLLVLAIALARRPPAARDDSLPVLVAVVVSYAYPYAQVAWMQWFPLNPVWPDAGLVLITLAAFFSLASLLTLGRRFGIRPALRGLATKGPYRLVRHPIYLAYVVADVGYNLDGWNAGTVVLVLAGWAAMIYRIHAEERVLARDAGWRDYVATVRYRLIPGLW